MFIPHTLLARATTTASPVSSSSSAPSSASSSSPTSAPSTTVTDTSEPPLNKVPVGRMLLPILLSVAVLLVAAFLFIYLNRHPECWRSPKKASSTPKEEEEAAAKKDESDDDSFIYPEGRGRGRGNGSVSGSGNGNGRRDREIAGGMAAASQLTMASRH